MAGRFLVLTPLLFLLTSCRQEQLSLPVAHAAGTEFHAAVQSDSSKIDHLGVRDSCYSYILLRPRDQRATAVQARLKKADEMEAAFRARKMTVDLLGDHANILSLQFPAAWPANAYARLVSSVIEDYFSSPEIQDYMCNAGFAQVRLSAIGRNDHRLHPLWTARITSTGLVKDSSSGTETTGEEPTEQAENGHPLAPAPPSDLKPN
ncbi:MAG TPA: hypothetical protein VMB49_16940 [Acidobacteriaceae bacterium]|nr:hypothetical protein [Acidobacteriaceae bacterium]